MPDQTLLIAAGAVLVLIFLFLFTRKSGGSTQGSSQSKASSSPVCDGSDTTSALPAFDGPVVCTACGVTLQPEHIGTHSKGKKHRNAAKDIPPSKCFVLEEEMPIAKTRHAIPPKSKPLRSPEEEAEIQAASQLATKAMKASNSVVEQSLSMAKPQGRVEDSDDGFSQVKSRAGKNARKEKKKQVMLTEETTFGEFTLLQRGINLIEGLTIHTNALTTRDEADLTRLAHSLVSKGWLGQLYDDSFIRNGSATERLRGSAAGPLTVQMGVAFEPGARYLAKDVPVETIPAEIVDICDKLVEKRIIGFTPDCATLMFLEPGETLAPRTECAELVRPFYMLMLAGDAHLHLGKTMHLPKDLGGTISSEFSHPVPRRSLTVFDGNSADMVQHGIAGSDETRIALLLAHSV